MESIIHADVFFFVATIALVVVALAVVILCVYVFFILQDIKCIIKRVKEGATHIGDTLETVATEVQEDGIVATLMALFHHKKKKRRS